MSMHLTLAWRNMLRNKRRTIIAGLAVGIGLGSIIFIDALFIGMERNMIRSATASFMGEAQIHRIGFRESFDVDLTIEVIDSVVTGLERSDIVARYSLRTMAFSMMSSPANMTGVSLVGVQPDNETAMSHIDDTIVEGVYFEGANARDVVIGVKLAEILEVDVGDRVVATATQAHSGQLAQEMLRVSGIYRSGINDIDRSFAFIRLDKSQEMLGLKGDAHEIAVTFTSPEIPIDPELPFWEEFSNGDNEALGWTRLLPQLYAVFEMSEFQILIMGLMLFGIVAFGIVNTLFMSLHERMFEFGVMRAVGTRGWDLFRIVLFEAASLSLVSMFLGAIIGLVATIWVGNIGIDYGGLEYAGVTIREPIYPMARLSQYIKYPLWVFALTTIVGIFPAASAARLTPATAMRKSF